MLTKKLILRNKLGLHARASAKFVTIANHYASDICIIYNNHKVNGKSIMDIMLLAANQDTVIELVIDGEDEIDALNTLENLINTGFGEKE